MRALFAVEEHVKVEATWGIYQRMIGAYRHPDKTRGSQLQSAVIDDLSHNVSTGMTGRFRGTYGSGNSSLS